TARPKPPLTVLLKATAPVPPSIVVFAPSPSASPKVIPVVVRTEPPFRAVLPPAFVVNVDNAAPAPTVPLNVAAALVLTTSARVPPSESTVPSNCTVPPMPTPALPPPAPTVTVAALSASASFNQTAPPVPATPLPERLPPL